MQSLTIIIIVIVVGKYAFDMVTGLINSRYSEKRGVPPELADVYDKEKYQKQQAYSKANLRLGIVDNTLNTLILVIVILSSIFAFADGLSEGITEHRILQSLIFFAIISLVSGVISLPFDIISTFKIDEKFGFNKSTPKIFVLDMLKGILLSLLLGGGLGYLLIMFYYAFPDTYWIIAGAVVSAFSLFFAMFYSTLIVPLFNKQTPLEEGALKESLMKLADDTGFSLKNVYVIDGSKRSTKSNAYFTGLGKTKRIVLYDTLIKDLTVEEITAVMAHEIGHYKKKHIVKSMLTGILQTFAILYLLTVCLRFEEISYALNFTRHTFHSGILAFSLLMTPLSMLIGIVSSYFSRKNEYEADAFAASYVDKKHLVSGLKKLSANNLSNLAPHPLYVSVNYSHPTLLQRMSNLGAENNSEL